MDWSIQQVAKLAGTTSRALRHYDDIGILRPTRISANGYRHYDELALVRLQRILLLRDLGLGLPAIGEVLDRNQSPRDALTGHLGWLRQEQDRLARQIAAVRSTIETLEGGEQLMAENMFDGFDHTVHKDEVTARWGADAYAQGDTWWRSKSAEDRSEWKRRLSDLTRDWVSAAESGVAADSAEAQSLAARHVEWLGSVPGTPMATGEAKAYVQGLGEMYVADPRFGENYVTSAGGSAGAEFVRDALQVFADTRL
ncbi:MerR family transcriptional regulator [Microbacterium sp. P03]|uniref:MerR family transcriptional regulator n=1 Tax=Microbacterium sp. P03 TaxID=3366946 RepID=UPI003745680E